MSVVFSLLRNDYAIVATDTRIMLLDGSYVDEYEKIYDTQYGWISGTGVGELIRGMIDKIDNSVDEKRHEEIVKLSGKYPLEELEKTLIVFSSLNSRKQLKMHYTGSIYSLTEIHPNNLLGMPPADIQDAEWDCIYNVCNRKIHNNCSNLNDDINYIADAIYRISRKCQSVSERCDIGILSKNGYKRRIKIKLQ